jgi:hypothetical protein
MSIGAARRCQRAYAPGFRRFRMARPCGGRAPTLNRVGKAPNDSWMVVSQLVSATFRQATAQHPALCHKWIQISARVGGSLPASQLIATVQMLGDLDMVLRCMEDDFRPSAVAPGPDALFAHHYQKMLTELWTGGAYAVFRLLDERKSAPEPHAIKAIHHDLRMIRIPLEKHEIAAEHKLGDAICMQRLPPNNDASDEYIYKPGDRARAHIMPTGVSPRGSIMWQVFDAKANRSYWLERRELSERIIASFEAS